MGCGLAAPAEEQRVNAAPDFVAAHFRLPFTKLRSIDERSRP
jgi:hypothetical protein